MAMTGCEDLHIICGKCGNRKYLEYSVELIENDEVEDGPKVPAVYIHCRNCGTLTGLDEILTNN